jgi:glycerophosphoryl diester phosphodiesterase
MPNAPPSSRRGQEWTVPLVIGHRGAPGYRPEHTEAAYRLAFELGADAVEPDIVATRDGVLVVRHENEISGTTDVARRPEFADRRTTKKIDGVTLVGWFTEDFTWAELSTLRTQERLQKLRPENTEFDGDAPILRLRDVLAIVDAESVARGREFSVVIEIKHAHYFASIGVPLDQLLHTELLTTGWTQRPDQLIIECFELGVLDTLRATGLPARYIFLLESDGAPADERAELGSGANRYEWYRSDVGLDSLVGRVDGISVAKADLMRIVRRGFTNGTNDLVQRAHQRGLCVFVWTLRPENHFLNPRFRPPGTAAHPRGDEAISWGDWLGEFRMVLHAGVDGIFVDHPDLGVAARAGCAAHLQRSVGARSYTGSDEYLRTSGPLGRTDRPAFPRTGPPDR